MIKRKIMKFGAVLFLGTSIIQKPAIITIKTNNRVKLMSVEVREHGANSAIYMGDK